MEITEIYQLISEKTQNIINNNLPFKSGKSLIFDFDEYSHVKIKKNNYLIFVKKDKKSEILETTLLHEFFHCLQHEDGFPDITRIDGTKDKLIIELSSFVLDLDVGDRLSNYGYNRFIGYKDMIEAYLSILYCNIDENLGLSEFLAYLNFFNYDRELREIIPLVKEFKPATLDNYQIICKGLKLYSHNNPKGVYKIFKYIIKGLKLENYVKTM